MNATSAVKLIESRWLTYSRGILFASPAVIAWGFACIFLVPKAREICRLAGLDHSGFGWPWPTTLFLVHWGRSILLIGILLLVVMDFVAPWWRRWRGLTVGLGVWLANVAVLFGLTTLLIIVLISAPSLAHAQ